MLEVGGAALRALRLEAKLRSQLSVVSGPLQEKHSAWGMSPLGTRKYRLPAAICQLNLYALCPMPYASFYTLVTRCFLKSAYPVLHFFS